MKTKLTVVFVIITSALIALCAVIFSIAAGSGAEYSRTVASQQNYSSTVLPFKRGSITDRDGTVLASSVQVYNLILEPKTILSDDAKNLETTVNALCETFGLDHDALVEAINSNPDSYYVRFGDTIYYDQKNAYEGYVTEYEKNAEDMEEETGEEQPAIVGVWFESDYMRTYPYGSLACDVLGFSQSDSGRGNYGLEQYYNEQLVGTNGRQYGYLGESGISDRVTRDPVDGNSIVTTLDYTIQSITETCLTQFLQTYAADNVSVIVMDPDSGEILAMASDKPYDLNSPDDISAYYTPEELAAMTEEDLAAARASIWANYAVSEAIEPGSTAKVMTVSAALEENLVNAATQLICDGGESFGNGANYIGCSGGPHGTLTVEDSLVYSCNDALMSIGSLLGADKLTKYLELFGFGKQTGIDLPGETSGLLHSVADIGNVTLATNSFGQNYNVSMVQLASAFCSAINGGYYYKPHMVRQIKDADGDVVSEISPTVMHRTVSSSTSEFIREALKKTVEEGTAQDAAIDGYDVAGKTGTAEKQPRDNSQYIVSFAGYAPADDPEVLIYVAVDNPSWANPQEHTDPINVSAQIAIELEKSIMEQVLPYMGILPQNEQANEGGET